MIRVLALVLPSLLLAGCFSQQPVPAVDRNSTAQSRAATAAQPSGPGYYTVKRGDTLYRIALDNGQAYTDIAAWNNIVNPSSIREGQVLRIAPPGPVENGGSVVAKPIDSGAGIESRSLDQPAASSPVISHGGSIKREPRVGKEPYSDEAYARLSSTGEVAAKPAETRVEAKPDPAAVAPPVAAGPDDVPWLWPTAGKLVAPYSEAGNKGLDFAGKAGDPVLAAGDGKVVYAGAGLRGYGELVIVKHNATFLSAYAHNRKILVKEGQQVSRGQKIAEMGNTDADSVKLHFEIRKQGKPVDPAQYLPKR
ncbi:peptidoglycan DD-metalloendopeptidase family protein [Dechloromonas denitrificans]|uniref:peptidoglycan DD-metalloendopeptidase family protein n=1 Tax=Dechloromonas denitrificans TaxID=281362 RepID=UPI001CF8D7FF|nr:peptidoglycan DD-metalloendopeptidase family protein [Dechloromonas denitrificans]UCV05315.1 peptidoglycan DD-metalloendopeptidase family protein [Dechloromonas denitrificans]UCV09661.1 peptidoglycan DD-metalloendopeptidase family protein [Dechloromonas denitrificans]